MRNVRFASGLSLPMLGQGTWRMGEKPSAHKAEIETLRRGLDLGLTSVDTAEMYGDGACEELVGAALRGVRERAYLVSKVYPSNAGRRSMPAACEASLKRLGTDRLELYLLHWPGQVPLEESVEAFERLVAAGKIRSWGVSNFDVADMEQLLAAGGQNCATNQILYNVSRRGPEFDLLPWMAAHAMPAMAYSPIEQGRLAKAGALQAVARKHQASAVQVALAFAIRSEHVMAIPKAATIAHLQDNAGAANVELDAEDLGAIDAAFPPPSRKRRLEML